MELTPREKDKLLLFTAALVAERRVLSTGGGVLAGGRLLPAPGGARDLWDAYAAAWRQYSRVVELLGTVDADAFGEPATVVLAEAAEAARWGGDLAAAVSLSERAVEGCPASVETAEITERAGRYLVEEYTGQTLDVAPEEDAALRQLAEYESHH